MLTGIWNRIDAVWATVKTGTSDAWGLVKDSVLGAVRGARDLISDIATGIWNRIDAVWTTVKTGTSTAWDAVKDSVLGGLRTARDTIGEVLTGIKTRVGDAWEFITKGAKAFGLVVGNTLERAFGLAANGVIGFINKIIAAINLIPGIPNIDAIGKVSVPGALSPADALKDVQQHARGGKITAPMAIVGEEAPRHPEYVIPTNPAYRSRAIGLYGQLSKELGIPGFKDGGVLGALGGAASSVASIPGDLLKGGSKWILDQLPDVKGLPDWIKGLGTYALKKVTGWIKDKVGSIVSSVSGGGGGSSVGGYTGPPADEKRLGDAAWVDSHTLAVTAFLDRKFGLTQSSGYRTPEHNAEINGAPGSHHTRGTPANPGATDSVGPLGAMHDMIAYARQHVAGLVEAMVDNYAGLGDNAHLAFFAKGGIIGGDGGSISAPFLGTFHNGGVAVSDGFAYVQEGERMIPRSQQLGSDGPSIEAVEVYIGGERIDERVDVQIRRRERESAAEFGAGVA